MIRSKRNAWRSLRHGLLASLLAASLASGPALSAGAVDGSEAAQLPSGTLAFASVAGLDELSAQLKQTGLWNALQKLPQVPQQLQEGWNTGVAEFEKNSGLAFNDVWTLLSGRLSVALVDLDLAAVDKGTPPGLILTLDLTGHMDQWNRVVIQKLLPEIDKGLADKDGTRTESDFQGSKLHTFAKGGTEMFYAVAHKERFVLSTRKALLEGFFQGPAASSLKDEASYAWVRKKLGDPGYILIYANLAEVWKSVRAYASGRPNLRADEQRVLTLLDELGLESLGGIGFASSVVKGGILDRFAIGFAQQPMGLVKILAEIKTGPLGSLKLAPKDAVLYSGSSIGNIGKLFAEVRRLLGTVLKPEEMQEFDGALAKFKENTGLDLETDLLAKLSGEMGLVLALPDLPVAILDNPVVGALGKLNEVQLAIYLGTEDPAAIETQLQSVLQKANVNATAEQHNGVAYHLVTIPNSPVFPGYALVGNQLVIGMNVLTLKNAIDLSKGGAGLESSERYKAAMANLSIGGSSAVSYMDLPGVVEVAGRLALAYFDKAKQKGEALPFDPATLPKPEEIAALVPPAVSKSTGGPDGLVAEYYSPFGYLPQMAFSGGINAYEQYRRRSAYEAYESSEAAPYQEEGETTAPAAEPGAEEPTSEAPAATEPSETTAEPSETTAEPSETTAEPSETTAEPSETTAEPSETTAEPSETASAAHPSASDTAPTGPVTAKQAPAAPQGWTTSSSTENMASYLSGDYQANASWFRTPFSPYLKLESFVDQVKSSSASMPGFKVVQEGALQIGGLKGRELAYEMGDGPARQRVRLIYLQDGMNLYTLTLQCAVAKCDTHQKAFDLILASLK
jgi:hypothetical protein